MTTTSSTTVSTSRRTGGLAAGLLLVVAGSVQGDGALLTSAYRDQSPVSDEQLSFPWSGATAVATSLIWGATQVLLVLGLAAFARSELVANGRGKRGAWLAVVGASLYVPAHALSIPLRDRDLDDSSVLVVLSLFGIGTVLMALGLLVSGAAVLRSGSWPGWRRWVPIGLGGWMVVMLPLQFTPALPVAVGLYSLIVVALGIALASQGGRESSG